MKKLAVALFVGLSITALVAFIPAEKKTLSANKKESYVEFRVPYFEMYNLLGRFRNFSVSMEYTNEDLSDAVVNAEVKVGSVVLPDGKQEKEFVKEYMFDASKFPYMKFSTTRIQRSEDGTLKVFGNMEIKGTSKVVVLDGRDNGLILTGKGQARDIEIYGKLNRFDFGINDSTQLHGGIGNVVGDIVDIRCRFLLE